MEIFRLTCERHEVIDTRTDRTSCIGPEQVPRSEGSLDSSPDHDDETVDFSTNQSKQI